MNDSSDFGFFKKLRIKIPAGTEFLRLAHYNQRLDNSSQVQVTEYVLHAVRTARYIP